MNKIVQPLIKIVLFLLIAWIVFPLIGFAFQIILALVLAFLLYRFIKNLLNKTNLHKGNKNEANSSSATKDNCDDNKKVIDVDYKDVE